MGSSNTEDAYCLKWNDFHTSITASFSDLRNEADLLDTVIVCEGQQLRAHRLVLSACSGVFRQLFRMSTATKAQHPVVLLWDVKAEDLKLLFNFMYEGQVNVAHEHLTNFLALAERLQVRGLTPSDPSSKNPSSSSGGFQSQSNATNSGRTNASSKITNTLSNRRPRSSPMAAHAAAKRIRPLPPMDDSSPGDMDDLPVPPPVKQELKVDESGTVFTQNSSSVGSDSQSGFSGAAGTSFNPFFSGSNSNDGAPGFESSAGPSSIPEGFSLQPGDMIDESSKGSVVVASLTVGQVPGVGIGGIITGMTPGHNGGAMDGLNVIGGGGSGSHQRALANNSGVCQICHKTFRQLRSHIADVHVPTPTPCPLCGKIFSSKHKMFGHKYRSCPNRTKNLVRHLEALDQPPLAHAQPIVSQTIQPTIVQPIQPHLVPAIIRPPSLPAPPPPTPPQHF